MSRGQMGKTFNTATEQNKAYNADANSSFSAAQGDIAQEQQGINNFGSEVDKFKAANPYVTGGAVQTADNQQLADTAAGLAHSGGQAIQSAAVRTGQNAGGAIAGTEEMAREGTRALSGEEAGATERRVAAGTGYGEEGMRSQLASQEAGIAGTEGQLAQGDLTTAQKAAEMPSFLEEVGQSGMKIGEAAAAAF